MLLSVVTAHLAMMSDQAGRAPSATSHPEFDVGFDVGYESAIKCVRARVCAVLREWDDYPESYPRTAFADDILTALEASSSKEANA